MRAARLARFVLLGLGLALLAYLTARLGVRQIAAMLVGLRWSIVPVLSLFAAHQAMRAAALTQCVTGPNPLKFLDAVWIRLSGEAVEFLTSSGPILAEPTKAWLLRKRGLDVADGLAATLAEYLASSLAAAATAVAGLTYVLTSLEPAGAVRAVAIVVLVSVTIFVALFAIGIAARVRMIGAVVRRVAHVFPSDGVTRNLPALDHAEGLLIGTFRDAPRRLAAILSLELIAQAFLGLELWCVMTTMGLPGGIVRALLIEGVTKFMNAAYFFVPGQIGVAEGTYAVIFSTFGLPAAAGLTVSFARRLRSLLAAGVGLVALSWQAR